MDEFSFREWFVSPGVTQLRGPAGIGLTTILRDLVLSWSQGSAWILSPSSQNVKPIELETLISNSVGVVRYQTLEEISQVAKEIVKTCKDNERPLVTVDDLPGFGLKDTSLVGGKAQVWTRILNTLTATKCTVVLTGVPRAVMSTKHLSLGPRVLDFRSDAIIDLDEIARNADGVIVEATATKHKRLAPGRSFGRLWIRPEHETPVCLT